MLGTIPTAIDLPRLNINEDHVIRHCIDKLFITVIISVYRSDANENISWMGTPHTDLVSS